MSFYAKMSETALKLLEKFGAPVVLQRTVNASIDPITGIEIAGTDASVTTTGLIKPYDSSMIDGERILADDRELILSNEHAPLPDDMPMVDGEAWKIISIKSVKPNGSEDVVYSVQVRR